MAPFVFKFEEEVLYATSVKATQARMLHGISLLGRMSQQLLVQCIDNTNYTLLSSKKTLWQLQACHSYLPKPRV